jgi:hypothetical protein
MWYLDKHELWWNFILAKDTANTLVFVAAILFILCCIGGFIGGVWYIWGYFQVLSVAQTLVPLFSDPIFGGMYQGMYAGMMASVTPLLIMAVFFIICGIFCIILAMRSFRWKEKLPGGNTLLIWGILGLIFGFGVGILLIVAHFIYEGA